jgi:hypothetical protein
VKTDLCVELSLLGMTALLVINWEMKLQINIVKVGILSLWRRYEREQYLYLS